MPRLLLDLTPLRTSPPYRRLWTGMTLAQLGGALGYTAVSLQVYDLTRSSAAVGLVGLVALGPLIVMGLYGGTLSDAHDRRTVAVASSVALVVVSLAMAAQALLHLDSLPVLLVLVALQSAAIGVNSPARSAIVPRLLPPAQLPAAAALSGMSNTAGVIAGPLLAGVLVSLVDFGTVYLIDAAGLVVATTSLLSLPRMPPLEAPTHRAGLASVLEGMALLRQWPNVRMTFLVDIVAMVTSMPRVLFPAIGLAVLGGGSVTSGALAAALAIGALAASVLSGPLGGVHRQGRAIVAAITSWGGFVALLGVVLLLAPGPAGGVAAGTIADGHLPWRSPWFWAACLALVGAGASDAVSAVFRTTVLQSATPDSARGRLQGVFYVVVAGGPRLGDAVLGGAASGVGERVVPLVGGLVCIAVVLALARRHPGFTAYDARHPTP